MNTYHMASVAHFQNILIIYINIAYLNTHLHVYANTCMREYICDIQFMYSVRYLKTMFHRYQLLFTKTLNESNIILQW